MFNIGFIALILSSIAFMPQVYYVYTTHDTHSLSIHTLILYALAQIFWFIHSFQTMDVSLMISPIINLGIYIYLVYKKFVNEYNLRKNYQSLRIHHPVLCHILTLSLFFWLHLPFLVVF